MKFPMYPENVGTRAVHDSEIEVNSHRCEGKGCVILSYVFSKKFSIHIVGFHETTKGLAAAVATWAKFKCGSGWRRQLFCFPVESGAMGTNYVHGAKIMNHGAALSPKGYATAMASEWRWSALVSGGDMIRGKLVSFSFSTEALSDLPST
jgi:hypothetical protein